MATLDQALPPGCQAELIDVAGISAAAAAEPAAGKEME